MEKKYRGVDGWLHSFSVLALVTDGRLVSHLERCTTEENASVTIGQEVRWTPEPVFALWWWWGGGQKNPFGLQEIQPLTFRLRVGHRMRSVETRLYPGFH